MLVLKQSTSIDIRMGPFVDATDGVTPETGITLGAADQAEVLKANGAATVAMGGTFAAVTGSDGWYDYTCAVGDVDTIGEVVFVVQDSSVCLPVFVRAQVVEESVYDDLFASGATVISDILTDTEAILTDAEAILVDTGTTLDTKLNDIQGATFNTATDSLEAIRDRGDSAWTGSPTTSDSGTAQAGAAGSITLQSGASATDDTYNGQVVYISAGTGVGQSRAISDYVGSTKVASVITNWATTPDNTSVYEVYPDDITEITAAPTAAQVADAVWDESTAGHTTGGTFGEQCKNDIDAILIDTGTTLDTIVDSILVDTEAIILDSEAILTDSEAILVDTGTTLLADTEALLVDSEAILVDSEAILVDSEAIKAKTDSLTFTVAGNVDANTLRINGAAVVGDGNATPWDGA